MKDIALYIQSCTTCQRVNNRMERPAHSLHPIRIGIDLIGPLPLTTSGNSYIVTCSDYFTKWPEAATIPDKSAATVAKFLYQLITRHGSPTIIQSDPPTQVTSKNVLGIEYILLQQNFYLLCKKSVQVQPRYLSVCDYSPRRSRSRLGRGGRRFCIVKIFDQFSKTQTSFCN